MTWADKGVQLYAVLIMAAAPFVMADDYRTRHRVSYCSWGVIWRALLGLPFSCVAVVAWYWYHDWLVPSKPITWLIEWLAPWVLGWSATEPMCATFVFARLMTSGCSALLAATLSPAGLFGEPSGLPICLYLWIYLAYAFVSPLRSADCLLCFFF